MTNLMDEIIGGARGTVKDPAFPHAPADWTPAVAVDAARKQAEGQTSTVAQKRLADKAMADEARKAADAAARR